MRSGVAGGLVVAAALALGGCEALIGIDDPVGNACDPFDATTCGEDETCDQDVDTGLLDCRPDGTAGAGMPCSEVLDCDDGLSCADGLCHTICNETNQCVAAADEAQCLYDLNSLRLCDNACDVMVGGGGGCPAGFECKPVTNYNGQLASVCRPETLDSYQPGEDCYDLHQCTETYGCYDPDGDLVGSCVRLCIVGDGGGPCPGNCLDFWNPLHGVDIGLCSS